MSILRELNTLLSPILPMETGMFSGVAPDEYIVLTPMADTFALFGDNAPLIDVSEVRISLFSKGNYINWLFPSLRYILDVVPEQFIKGGW